MSSRNRTTSPFQQLLHYLLGLPRSLYVNFRCLPFRQAVHMPILVSHHTRLKHLSGKVVVSGRLKMGLVKIGLGTSQMSDFRSERTVVDFRGCVEFNGKCKIGAGARLFVADTGTLVFHDNFCNSSHLSIICFQHIEFGNNNHVSWHTLIMDSDQHSLLNDAGERINPDAPVRFGDNVWCGCNVLILKGTELTRDVVVAAGAVVHGTHETPHVILAGNPAKIVKSNVSLE